MTHVMIDLETLGTGSNAAILSIGAVKFGSKGLGDEFYRVIDPDTCQKAGLSIDASTIVWWMQQDDEARGAFDFKARNGVSLFDALNTFGKWIDSDDKIWGNGASFDNAILANAYRAVNLDLPWKFWNDRCYRTMKGMFKVAAPEREGTYHNALDDARYQAEHMVAIMKSIT